MEHMELDEIVRIISKRSWERFQTEMDNLEYQRRNSDLEHRIKMLRLQLNVSQLEISNNIPSQNTFDHERFGLELRDAFHLRELKREKCMAMEKDYHRMMEEIHSTSKEIIEKFENLSTVKKKRYFEKEIDSARQEIHNLVSHIAVLKQQLNEKRFNHDQYVQNFIVESVINGKSLAILRDQIKTCGQRLNEVCNEIGITRNDVMIKENQVAEVRKVYEQLKIELELINSQIPRMIAKLPLTYDSLEQDGDSPITGSPPISIPSPQGIEIIDDILIKPADTIIQPQLIDIGENLKLLDEPPSDKRTIPRNLVKSQEILKPEKSKKSTKRSNRTLDDKPSSSLEIEDHPTTNLIKKSKITADREIIIGKKVEFSTIPKTSPRKLRSQKITRTMSNQHSHIIDDPEPIEMEDEVEQLSQTFNKLSPRQGLKMLEADSSALKDLSPTIPDTSLLSNIRSNSNSFQLNFNNENESICTSNDSNDNDFFITSEGGGDGFNFFQTDTKHQLF